MKKKLLDLLAKKRGIVDRMRQADAAGDQTAFDAALAENTAVDAEIARVKAIMEAEENVPAEPEGVPTSGTDPPAAEPVNSRACMPLRSASAPRHAASVQPLRPTQTFCVVPWQPKTPVP